MTVRCIGCGTDNPDRARWCGRCGVPLEEQPAAPTSGDLGADAGPWATRAPAIGLLVAVIALAGLGWWLGGTTGERPSGTVEVPQPLAPGDAGRGGAGSVPAECRQGPTMSAPLTGRPCRRWSVAAPAELRGWLVADADLYLTDGRGFVEARSLDEGVQRWATRVEGATQVRATGAGALYVTADDRELLALGRDDGGTRWRYRIDPAAEPVPGAGETIRRVLPTPSGVYLQVGAALVALDVDAGDVRWTWSEQHVLSAGTSGGRPYVVVVDGVVGLAPIDGRPRWRVPRITFDTRPHAASDGDVVVGDDSSQVSLLSGRTGDVRWTRDLGALPVSVAVTGPHVAVQGRPGRVWTLGRADGAVRWAAGGTPEPLELLAAGPDEVLTRARGRPVVILLDAVTGRERWRRAVDGLDGAFLGRGEVVVDAEREIGAVDLRDGSDRWSVALAGRVLHAGPGPLLVASPGALHAIDPPRRPFPDTQPSP